MREFAAWAPTWSSVSSRGPTSTSSARRRRSSRCWTAASRSRASHRRIRGYVEVLDESGAVDSGSGLAADVEMAGPRVVTGAAGAGRQRRDARQRPQDHREGRRLVPHRGHRTFAGHDRRHRHRRRAPSRSRRGAPRDHRRRGDRGDQRRRPTRSPSRRCLGGASNAILPPIASTPRSPTRTWPPLGADSVRRASSSSTTTTISPPWRPASPGSWPSSRAASANPASTTASRSPTRSTPSDRRRPARTRSAMSGVASHGCRRGTLFAGVAAHARRSPACSTWVARWRRTTSLVGSTAAEPYVVAPIVDLVDGQAILDARVRGQEPGLVVRRHRLRRHRPRSCTPTRRSRCGCRRVGVVTPARERSGRTWFGVGRTDERLQNADGTRVRR